jgi:hypothetical protein
MTDACQPIYAFYERGIATNNYAEIIRRHRTKLFARATGRPENVHRLLS